jgi:hypothetical protein
VRDNGNSITTLSSSAQMYTITGRSAGAHNIKLVNQAGYGCTADLGTATLTDPPAAAGFCEWGFYSNSGNFNSFPTLLTSSATPSGTVDGGTARLTQSSNGTAATLISACRAYNQNSYSPTYVCGHTVVTQPVTCIVNSGAGTWQNSSATTSYPSGEHVARVYDTPTNIMQGGSVVGTFNPGNYFGFSQSGWFGTNVFIPEIPVLYAFKKLATGGPACTKDNGTAGTTSTYVTQILGVVCDTCSGDCSGCHWYDAGAKTPTGSTTTVNAYRCE